MRPATKIRDLANECITALEPALITPESARTTVVSNLLQIRTIATDLDARTGTIDPSQKKGWFKRLFE